MPANFVSLTKECGLFLPLVYITHKYTKMATEMARFHNVVTCLITRVCDEPASLQPYCMRSLARKLPKTPLSRYTVTTATCRGNQKCKQHVAFAFGVGLGVFLPTCGSAEHPCPYHCLSGEKSPTTCPPGFFSSVLHSWLNDENHALQGKVAAEE